jgi:periplasmic protein TonB
MRALFIFLLFATTTFISTNAQVVKEETMEEVFIFVEEQPEFPGGEAEMQKFIVKNIIYPALAKEAYITGKVYVEFTVDKDGSITNVVCKKGIGGGCDEEAVRVIKLMPKWKPGKQSGRPIRTKFILPIRFDMK